ncbi:MAG: arginine--tRNA ligase [Candidatus Diapherotrites archaeon]
MSEVNKAIAKALAKAIAAEGVKEENVLALLEKPPNPELGDFAFPCFKLAAQLKKAPQQIAAELHEKMAKISGVERIETAGAYLNFFVEKGFAAKKIIPKITGEKQKFGLSKEGRGKKALIEFCSPNANKPLHLGHLRNICLGESIARLYEAKGFKVPRTQVVNDRGIHITKTMLAFKLFGKGKTPQKEKKKPDHFVGDYYVKYNKEAAKNTGMEMQAQELLRKWEKKEKEAVALWKKITKWVLEGFNETYKELNVKFDKTFFESQLYEKGRKIVNEGVKKGVFKKKEGAVIVELEEFGLPNKILLRSDGTSLYMTQDLFLAKKKFEEFKFQQSIYVVGSEQNLYFRQLFKTLELLGFKWANRLRHLSYGMVNLPSGKMKSREGTVVDADNLLAELRQLAEKELKKRYKLDKKELEKRKNAISLAAVKFYLLKTDAAKDMLFNPEESISFEGETGPYVLYSYARAKSIKRKARETYLKKIKFDMLKEDSEKKLVLKLAEYENALGDSFRNLSPHTLCHYLLELASAFNSFYHELPVLKAEKDVMPARLELVEATAHVLKNGLNVLGIEVLEKM